MYEDSKTVFDTRFPICVLRTEKPLGEQSWGPIWSYVAYSINLMYQGNYPTMSFDNTPLQPCGRYIPGKPMYECHGQNIRFRLTELRGDWKHHQQVWGLVKAAFTSNNVCHICEASRANPACSMLEFTRQPAWSHTIRSHRVFLTEILGSSACSLIYIKGFHYSMIRWCAMHAIQLGAGLFNNGGCFYELMKVSWFPGGTVADRYRNAFRDFKDFCSRHKIKCGQPIFKPWMYVSSGEESCTFRSKDPRSEYGSMCSF